MQWTPVLVLPDDANVCIAGDTNGSMIIAIDSEPVLAYRRTEHLASLVLSAIGTPFEHDNSTPNYPVLELSLPPNSPLASLSIPDVWAAIYALWTVFHEQEQIPVILSASSFKGFETSLEEYLLISGLGRKPIRYNYDSVLPYIFLQRATFWQGAGQGPLWWDTAGASLSRTWLQTELGFLAATFPDVQSFTRSDTVIAAHPQRAPKPRPGNCVYRRFCGPVGKMLSLKVIDVEDERHRDAFHRWMNDDVVNEGWGERGDEEKHVNYMKTALADPHVLPVMMSWDEELMGYVELTWIKEDHVATYIPDGPLDYDRGLHVLVGEKKFRGGEYSQCWMRSLNHYLYLSDPRTRRTFAEPKSENAAMIKACGHAQMLAQTSFYFPYKHSLLVMGQREQFFKSDMLR